MSSNFLFARGKILFWEDEDKNNFYFLEKKEFFDGKVYVITLKTFGILHSKGIKINSIGKGSNLKTKADVFDE